MKLEIKDIYSVAGQDCNEDAIGYGENFLFVIDGATGLTKAHITDEKSDARWFAMSLQANLSREFQLGNQNPIKNIVYEIIDGLCKDYITMAHYKGIELPPDFPSAGIALFLLRDGHVEFYGLGDCVGVVKLKNGTYQVFRDKVLPALDEISINTMVEIAKKEAKDVISCKDEAMDVILENRMKRNKKDGYMILDLSNEGTLHPNEAIFNQDEVDSIFVMSDGFAQLYDTFNVYQDAISLSKAMESHTLKELTKTLFDAQENDKGGNIFPRLKFRDDTTSGWAKLK